MSTRPDARATREWHEAWRRALDALEQDVATVEAQLRTGTLTAPATAWTPPRGLGPLPKDLVPRADSVLARQFAAAQAIALSIASNRKQAAAILRVEVGSQGRPRAAFVDTAA